MEWLNIYFHDLLCSEFEELEAVPTMAVMDGPLEPPSSTPINVSDVPDDPAFVNFFSVSNLFFFEFFMWLLQKRQTLFFVG